MIMILSASEQKNDITDMVESKCVVTLTGTGRKGESIAIEFEAVSLSKTGYKSTDTEIEFERVRKPGPIRLPGEFLE